MNAFPQLSSGAISQNAYSGAIEFRTRINEQPDGVETSFSDIDFERRVWELNLNAVTDAEWAEIETLFNQSGGRYGTFLFLEPGSNLLAWSEQSQNPVWQASGGAQTSDGSLDPKGGAGGFQITGPSGAVVSQSLGIPASHVYCASVHARTSGTGAVLRVTDGAGSSLESPIDSGNVWKRYWVRFPGGSAETTVRFELQAGDALLDVYGPQLEPQPAPSAYKTTQAQSGVFPGARFDDDMLTDRAIGLGLHSGALRIVWTPSQT